MNGIGKVGLALTAGLLMTVAARAEVLPAELPPPGYAGLQYVDSRGCAFIRAGTAAETIWVIRVSPGGAPMCDNPPSGNRVAIDGEATADADARETASAEATLPVGAEAFFVAVGSFGVVENADKAVEVLKELGYAASSEKMQGGSGALVTVFAGPFASAAKAQAARDALRGAGFPDAVVLTP